MKSIILIGNGGHCKSCIEIIESSREYKIKGIITQQEDPNKFFMNYKVLGNDLSLDKCFEAEDYGLVCVGQIKSPNIRIKLFDLLNKNKIKLAIVKSTSSIISRHALINYGTIVMHNSIINAGAKVGRNCILNTNCLIEHDAKIGNHCHISTGAIINGNVSIGNECFIGSGCIIKEGIKIGERVIVSAGQIIMSDIPSDTIIRSDFGK